MAVFAPNSNEVEYLPFVRVRGSKHDRFLFWMVQAELVEGGEHGVAVGVLENTRDGVVLEQVHGETASVLEGAVHFHNGPVSQHVGKPHVLVRPVLD